MASAEGSRDVEYNTAVRWLACVRAIRPRGSQPDDMMLNRTPDPGRPPCCPGRVPTTWPTARYQRQNNAVDLASLRGIPASFRIPALRATPAESTVESSRGGEGPRCRRRPPVCGAEKCWSPLLASRQARAIFLPGIGSAIAVRHAGAPKGSAKYCVSCTTCSSANSIMLTE
jgi:hypothetical protein